MSGQYSDDDRLIKENETVRGTRIDKGTRSSRRKPAGMPICLPQIPKHMNLD
jgi:hypothetical protein